MRHTNKIILCFIACLLAGGIAANPAAAEQPAYTPVGQQVNPPIGWVQFCANNPKDCDNSTTQPVDIVMSPTTWKALQTVNRHVNETVKPITDQEHWGVIEKWSYPTDGYGDCEEYALLKRKTLLDAGWPREALLITVVRDRNNEGHAVLTVKTDKGEFILDNENEKILPSTETGYRFVKRQAQSNGNIWVSLGTSAPAAATASAR